MRKFSTLIHLKDDSHHMDRTLDSLKISDELLVVDHVATEETRDLLRRHGANVLEAIDGVHDGAYATNAINDWVLLVNPSESPDGELRAALERWQKDDSQKDDEVAGYTVAVGLHPSSTENNNHRELRFVNRTRINWMEELPNTASNVLSFPGSLLRVA
jgi:hypothetical protein